jgi:hypothetical protein
LVKTREGRPIHIKGNPRFGINHNPSSSKGSINARINSSVLSLYDNERLKEPMMKGTEGMAAEQVGRCRQGHWYPAGRRRRKAHRGPHQR